VRRRPPTEPMIRRRGCLSAAVDAPELAASSREDRGCGAAKKLIRVHIFEHEVRKRTDVRSGSFDQEELRHAALSFTSLAASRRRSRRLQRP
jgi:hypothetical protein